MASGRPRVRLGRDGLQNLLLGMFRATHGSVEYAKGIADLFARHRTSREMSRPTSPGARHESSTSSSLPTGPSWSASVAPTRPSRT
mgnify:CR=1 FL=1|jgi:hypothetical protein